ncbi:ComEA family DNA-binding protein [Arhodomonas aquaeolei]|uniref:ComEA family DNA-binding protein n=1 Tax=Arhodomonas aquaeolei TaxID=2369 RepID=UPI00146D063A
MNTSSRADSGDLCGCRRPAPGAAQEEPEQGQSRAESWRDTACAAARGIDIDTADFDCLHAIPHIGPERAQAIIGRRPLEGIEQLTALGGISPKRLQRFGISA